MKIKLPPHHTSLAQALVSLFGNSVAITQTDRLSGGDINKAYGLTLNTGDHIFMKANAKSNADFFTAEVAGLSAIESTGAIKTPGILCTGTDNGEDIGYSFLLLKFIKSAKPRSDYWETFARELAALHKADTKKIMNADDNTTPPSQDSAAPAAPAPGVGKFGFFQNNYIGSRAQDNTKSDSWISFFRDSRLAPQFKAADSYFTPQDRNQITKLLDHLEDFLLEPARPSLLHGDLWSGNVMCGPEGKAMLIDPASYIGHAEVDLAMTELFGGFPESFYQAYREVNPLEPGYENRRDLYNLYQLLNHLNLFGPTYLGPVLSIVDEYVG
ncbi:MAG: fructosamine kinase family protein [Treponema sp.]|nr:fructosamine kinase family protein [Treponema sp.]